MESVTGKFRTRRYRSIEGIGIFLVIIGVVTFLIVSGVVAKSTSKEHEASPLWLLLVVPVGVAITGILVILSSRADKMREFTLTFCVDADAMTITKLSKDNKEKVVAQNLLWHEAHIVEYFLGYHGDYATLQQIRRYVRLRLWNSKEQVMLVEDLPDGWNPGYPIQTLTTASDYPDYFSITPGILEKVEQMFGSKPKRVEKVWC